jgi:hypothetical protein
MWVFMYVDIGYDYYEKESMKDKKIINSTGKINKKFLLLVILLLCRGSLCGSYYSWNLETELIKKDSDH